MHFQWIANQHNNWTKVIKSQHTFPTAWTNDWMIDWLIHRHSHTHKTFISTNKQIPVTQQLQNIQEQVNNIEISTHHPSLSVPTYSTKPTHNHPRCTALPASWTRTSARRTRCTERRERFRCRHRRSGPTIALSRKYRRSPKSRGYRRGKGRNQWSLSWSSGRKLPEGRPLQA